MKETLLYRYILKPDPNRAKVFRYSDPMVFLLSKLAEVPAERIANTRIHPRTPARYIPFYPAHKGGGAITLGNKNWQSITYTENFFSANKELYGNAAYANKVSTWLRLSAHEAGHLNHTERYGSIIIYLIVFIYQYLRYGHDGAPLEKEADTGPRNLTGFKRHLAQKQPGLSIEELITSDHSDEEKVQLLQQLWNGYISQQD